MIKDIKFKLEIISDIYSHYILNYKKCQSNTRFRKDKPAYSFSDTMSYLGDTLGIISNNPNTDGFSSTFAYHISLLQAIYVQQDLILEILYLVNCEVDKGHLLKDSNYSINRNIRNELIGHPIRKTTEKIENTEKKKTVLLSSVLMDIHSSTELIKYARYHKDNNYEFEKLSFETREIISRHYVFLNYYLDIVIEKLKLILKEFSDRVSNILKLIDEKPFELIIKLVSIDFESISGSYYCYDEQSLLEIHKKSKENERYEYFINKYIKDLKGQLEETVREIPLEFEEKVWKKIEPVKKIDFDIVLPKTKVKVPVTYHYEIGKLATKRNSSDFEFFSGFLRDKCKNNQLIQSELNHMENNIYNPIEYYTSLNLIKKNLSI